MTEPKPTQWEFIHCTKTATYLQRRDGDVYHEARFIGPDREANARKFMHMDELELENRKLCAYVEDLPTKEMVSGMPIVRRIDAILAKIDGNVK